MTPARLGALVLLGLLAAACTADVPDRGATRTAGSAAYPVTIDNCGTPLRIDKRPTRVVSNDVNSTEYLLALGLADTIKGTFGVSAPAVGPEYAAEFARVPHASPKYLTLEPLVGLDPDFLFAGWNYGLERGSATLTPEALGRRGIATLALTESCVHVQPGRPPVSIDDTYTDLRNLGAVFDRRERAAQVIADMKTKVADVQATVAGRSPVSVFVYDSGQDAPFTAPARAMPNALIALAGGRNVFADLDQSWTSVSWEKVVAADPDCILVNDYATPTWQQKADFLSKSPITKDLRAVKAGCIWHLRYDQITPGPLNAQAVESIARWLHPDAYRG